MRLVSQLFHKNNLESLAKVHHDIPSDQVLIGATVRLMDLDSGEELEYILVSGAEADYTQNKISKTLIYRKSRLIINLRGVKSLQKIPSFIVKHL